MSAKSTVITRRSSSLPAVEVPQLGQKRAPAGIESPHEVQSTGAVYGEVIPGEDAESSLSKYF